MRVSVSSRKGNTFRVPDKVGSKALKKSLRRYNVLLSMVGAKGPTVLELRAWYGGGIYMSGLDRKLLRTWREVIQEVFFLRGIVKQRIEKTEGQH